MGKKKDLIKVDHDDFIIIHEALTRQKEFYSQFLNRETRINLPETYAYFEDLLLKTEDVLERLKVNVEWQTGSKNNLYNRCDDYSCRLSVCRINGISNRLYCISYKKLYVLTVFLEVLFLFVPILGKGGILWTKSRMKLKNIRMDRSKKG